MPIYEFECRKCKAHLEVFQKLSDKAPTKCKKCGGRLEKLFSTPAIQFKGSGWYVTDYARSGNKAEKTESEPSASDTTSETKGKEASPKTPTKEKTSPTKAPSGD